MHHHQAEDHRQEASHRLQDCNRREDFRPHWEGRTLSASRRHTPHLEVANSRHRGASCLRLQIIVFRKRYDVFKKINTIK